MPAKIVHVNTARGYRGGERQTELLIRGLASRGVRQALVARRGAPLASRLRDVGHRRSRSCRRPAVGRARDARCVVDSRARRPQRLRGVPALAVVGHAVRDHAPRQQSDSRRIGSRTRHIGALPAWPPSRRKSRRSSAPTTPQSACASFTAAAAACRSTRRKSAAIRASFAGKFVVGHVGALDNGQKGQEFIIAVARELERSHPDRAFRAGRRRRR